MFCTYCGKRIPDDSVFCLYCGRKLAGEEVNEEIIDEDTGFASSEAEYTKPEVIPVQDTVGIDIIYDLEKKINRKEDSAQREESSAEEEPGQPRNKPGRRYRSKAIMLVAAAAIILVCAAILFLNGFDTDPKPRTREDPEYTLRSSDVLTIIGSLTKHETYIYNSLGGKIYTLNSSTIPFYCRDASAALLMNTLGYRYTHYVYENNVYGFRKSANLAKISGDGRYIYYVVHTDNDSTLYFCDAEGITEKMLAVFTGRRITYLAVSPDGRTVAYSVAPISSDGSVNQYDSRVESFIIRDGKDPESFGAGCVIEEISDDGELIYYTVIEPDSDELYLYVDHAKGSTLLSRNMKNTSLYFNESLSEVIISEGNTLISISGGEPLLLTDSPAAMVLMPQNSITRNNDVFGRKVYDISTFSKAVLLCSDYTLMQIGEDYWVEEIGKLAPVEEVSNALDDTAIITGKAVMSDDGNEIIYISNDNKLVKASEIMSGTPDYTTLALLADDFAVSYDFRHVYYSWNTELYYINNNGESIFIDQNTADLTLSADGTAVFYRLYARYRKGPLYCSIAGSSAQRVNDVKEISTITYSDNALLLRQVTPLREYLYLNLRGVDIIPISNYD